jgi:hypothetical protein
MQTIDFARSFVTFVTAGRGNNARLQLESTCALIHRPSGRTLEYVFFASCKSEDTYAPRDLFYPDNYDFCGLFSDTEYAIFRTRATHHAGWRDSGSWRGRFDNVYRTTRMVAADELVTDAAVVQATLAGAPLVGSVAFTMPGSTWEARLEFPIKTMNVNDIQVMWQVDTGPVAWPDLMAGSDPTIGSLSPAYVAYNRRDRADFVIQQSLAVAAGAAAVTHYSRLESVAADARVWAVQS